ncbi:hypothetical protein HAX54_052502, partial [Datura stramonium]|nr:hypothetical protein [Datura stramonium]
GTVGQQRLRRKSGVLFVFYQGLLLVEVHWQRMSGVVFCQRQSCGVAVCVQGWLSTGEEKDERKRRAWRWFSWLRCCCFAELGLLVKRRRKKIERKRVEGGGDCV